MSAPLVTGAVATIGVSPKAKLAAALPFIGTLLAVLIHLAITGEWDKVETEGALIGLGSTALAFAGAWIASPGAVTDQVVTPSDSTFDPAVAAQLRDKP